MHGLVPKCVPKCVLVDSKALFCTKKWQKTAKFSRPLGALQAPPAMPASTTNQKKSATKSARKNAKSKKAPPKEKKAQKSAKRVKKSAKKRKKSAKKR